MHMPKKRILFFWMLIMSGVFMYNLSFNRFVFFNEEGAAVTRCNTFSGTCVRFLGRNI